VIGPSISIEGMIVDEVLMSSSRGSMSSILLLQSIWRILKRMGSMSRRLWRRNIWWRMRLKDLCSWWIVKRRRGSVRMRVWRMNTWWRMMMKNL
jgi:hypothetical protein